MIGRCASSCISRRRRRRFLKRARSVRLSPAISATARASSGLDLNELFRVGRWALAIGVAVLSFSVIIGQAVLIRVAPQPFAELIAESLLIFGWVANWRPIEIFLYDWWPLVRRRNLYQRLAAAQVELKPFKSRRGGRIPPGD